jgi:uncharacterized protein DUF4386
MTPAELNEERRLGRFAGVAAIFAGIVFPAGLIWAQIINKDLPDKDKVAQLRYIDRHAGQLIASSAIRTVALLALIVTAVHLYRATKSRNPQASSVILVTGVLGPAALAIGGLAHDVGLAIEARDFAERAIQTKKAAEDVTKSPFQLFTLGLSVAGTLSLGFWFVVASLHAMRAGLLNRFMGILGIIIGPSFLFPFPPVVMAFWLVAVGALLLRVWPRGIPPAWDAGEAIPWPSTRERLAAEAEEPAGSPNGEVDPVGPEVLTPQREEAPQRPDASAPRRRKRKR